MLLTRDFPGDSDITNLLVMQETQVQCLGQEDPLEEKMATHSSILAWRIPCTEKCHELQFKGFIKNQIQFSD